MTEPLDKELNRLSMELDRLDPNSQEFLEARDLFELMFEEWERKRAEARLRTLKELDALHLLSDDEASELHQYELEEEEGAESLPRDESSD